MRLSVFTTVTRPGKRGDGWLEAFRCYSELADELVFVNGDNKAWELDDTFFKKHQINPVSNIQIVSHWPKEFSWEFISQQFQTGYEACTGDWVIHMDLDFLFHEKDFEAIRKACKDNSEAPALSFYKWQFIQPDRYNLKSRLVIAVNKGKYGDRIKFNGGGDLCQPTLDGEYISPNDVPESGVEFYNYEKLCKTRKQVADDTGRMERAYKRHFGKTQYGSNGTDEDALEHWIAAQKGKYSKPQKKLALKDHPKYIQETIINLNKDQFGAGGWGLL